MSRQIISFSRIAGIGAAGFAAAIVLGNVILAPAGLPVTGSEIGEVQAFFSAKGDLVGVASLLGPATWVLATLFGAGAVAALWRSERERGEAWSLAGFAGLLLQNTTFTGVMATRLALTSTAGHDGSATTGLWALHDALFGLNGTFLALALVGLSVSGLRSGLIRRWHATLGLAAAALQFTSATLTSVIMDEAGPLGLIGLAGWLMWVVWLGAWGLALIRLAPAPRVQPAG
ncbi:hypothetical protein [Nonomuraea sp. NPDC049480]|uniref:hypothetical protein n=1 Tax=Nonomuraea sp. NPDC049480 TaxID=3364353 RepID=UPI0037BA3819